MDIKIICLDKLLTNNNKLDFDYLYIHSNYNSKKTFFLVISELGDHKKWFFC